MSKVFYLYDLQCVKMNVLHNKSFQLSRMCWGRHFIESDGQCTSKVRCIVHLYHQFLIFDSKPHLCNLFFYYIFKGFPENIYRDNYPCIIRFKSIWRCTLTFFFLSKCENFMTVKSTFRWMCLWMFNPLWTL